MKILLIAGHGAGDPGACACGYQEANLTREVANMLVPALQRYADVTLYDTSRNMYSDLKAGKSFAFSKYDYVLEIHFNAAVNDQTGNGITTGSEILVHPKESGIGVEQAILSGLQAIGYRNRGVKRRSDLLVMNTCKGRQGVSYALIEVCFIDDRDDVNLYQSKKNETVSAIVNGIVKGFGLISKNDGGVTVFPDVSENDYAYNQIKKLKDYGIVNGDENGNYNPDAMITRRDMAVIIANMLTFIGK